MTELVGKKVKTVQFQLGLDLLGSKLSLQHNTNNDLEITPFGVLAISKVSERTVLIPFNNIKGLELLKEGEPTKIKRSRVLQHQK